MLREKHNFWNLISLMLLLNWCVTLFQLFVLEISGDSEILEMGGDHTVIKNGTTSYGQRVRFNMFTLKFSLSTLFAWASLFLSHIMFLRKRIKIWEPGVHLWKENVFSILILLTATLAHVNTHVSKAAVGPRMCSVRPFWKFCDMARHRGNVMMRFLPSVATVTLWVEREEARSTERLTARDREMGNFCCGGTCHIDILNAAPSNGLVNLDWKYDPHLIKLLPPLSFWLQGCKCLYRFVV